jgi:hypothetical protein
MAVFATLSLSGATAQAQVFITPGLPPFSPGYRPQSEDPRHSGAFVRGVLGAGYAYWDTSVMGTSSSLSGLALSADLSVGGLIARNLVLHGDIVAVGLPSPAVVVPRAVARDVRTVYILGLVGGGLTFYLSPRGLFVSTSVGLATLLSDTTNGIAVLAAGPGFGARAMVGHDWQVGRRVRVGVAGSVFYAFLSGGRSNGVSTLSWNDASVALVLTTTYH